MSAFNDGSCAWCKRRMGWTGEATDKPACPHCGHKPSAKEMESLLSDQKEMERLLISKAEGKRKE